MLNAPAPFPHPGAEAFLRGKVIDKIPAGTACRIMQNCNDGRVLVTLSEPSKGHPDIRTRASGTPRVKLTDLAETREAALGKRPRAPRRSKSALKQGSGKTNKVSRK